MMTHKKKFTSKIVSFGKNLTCFIIRTSLEIAALLKFFEKKGMALKILP